MIRNLFLAVKLTLWSVVLCIVVYPLLILAIAQLGPNHGLGATVESNGKVVGYALVGQSFNQDQYFWGRPSAVAYNAAGSAGSNKGPTNPDYLKDVQSRVDSFLAHNPAIKATELPSELVTASGSGLDPDISPEAALVQVSRVANARGLGKDRVRELVSSHIHAPLFGILGTSHVNVLDLNIALNDIKP
jgi:potassium-transporting ATPase KdpC subunit